MSGNNQTSYLKAKIQIGNTKGPLSYNRDQSVFHYDDIPIDKRNRRNEVKNWKKSKLLSEETPAWNQSVQRKVILCDRRTTENFIHDRSKAFNYNYRAETLDTLKLNPPIDKPTKYHISTQLTSTALEILKEKESDRIQNGIFHRNAEMPVHPKLQDAPKWEVSTAVADPKSRERSLSNITDHSLRWTAKVNKGFSEKTSYSTPIDSSILYQEEVRKQKLAGCFDSTKKLFRPRSAPIDRTVLVNRYKIEKPSKLIVHKHSGVWETSKIDGRSMWSDTGSYEYNSKGDTKLVINLDKFNVEAHISPNNNTFPTIAKPATTTKQVILTKHKI
eukprot:gene6780-9287_t